MLQVIRLQPLVAACALSVFACGGDDAPSGADGGVDGPSVDGAPVDGGPMTCPVQAGCYEVFVSNTGNLQGCSGTFSSLALIEDTGDAFAEYRDDPDCAFIDPQAGDSTCTMRMACFREGGVTQGVRFEVTEQTSFVLELVTSSNSGSCVVVASYELSPDAVVVDGMCQAPM